MSNKHLYPLLSIFFIFILLTILTVLPIPMSPLMITAIVVTTYISGVIYHLHKNTITNEKVAELALLAFIVQFTAISFL